MAFMVISWPPHHLRSASDEHEQDTAERDVVFRREGDEPLQALNKGFEIQGITVFTGAEEAGGVKTFTSRWIRSFSSVSATSRS